MNIPLTVAAWVAALALIVMAGVSAYTTFFESAEPEVGSWVEFEACFRINGVEFPLRPDIDTSLVHTADERCAPFFPTATSD
jgi:hypothetical protein